MADAQMIHYRHWARGVGYITMIITFSLLWSAFVLQFKNDPFNKAVSLLLDEHVGVFGSVIIINFLVLELLMSGLLVVSSYMKTDLKRARDLAYAWLLATMIIMEMSMLYCMFYGNILMLLGFVFGCIVPYFPLFVIVTAYIKELNVATGTKSPGSGWWWRDRGTGV